MDPINYPEIEALREIHRKHNVTIRVSKNEFLMENKSYPAVTFSLGGQSFKLFVDDEYEDFKLDSSALSLCLILRELESYKDEDSYQSWCKAQLLDPVNTEVKAFYKSLNGIYPEIEKILGEVNSQISDYDFGLNAGAAQELRKT